MPKAAKAATSKEKPSTSDNSDKNEQIVLSHISAGGSKGCYDEDLEKLLPDIKSDQRILIINKLITKRLIDVYNAGDRLIYKVRTEDKKDTPEGLKGADTEEKIVFGIIRDAGNKGIWMRDIRFESKLQPTVLNKILKSLENKKIIKAVKSVSRKCRANLKDVQWFVTEVPHKGPLPHPFVAPVYKCTAYKKKVYMLYDLEPDSTLTGGSWYSDQDFESEFVDVLNQQCYRYLLELKQKHESDPNSLKKGPVAVYSLISVPPSVVCKFITDLGISKVSLSEEDIQTILETLVFDGKVEREVQTSGERLYRAVSPLTGPAGLATAPCGTCPVIADCRLAPTSQVSPLACPYLATWGAAPLIKPDPVS